MQDDLPPETGKSLTFVHLLPGVETAFEVQRKFEAWAAENSSAEPYLDVTSRNVRLVLCDRRCLAFAPAQSVEDCLAAAAAFSHTYSTLSSEEALVQETWPAMAADVALTHDVRRAALREQTRVNSMTRRFQSARILVTRIDIALQRREPTLSPAAKRLFGEFALQSDLASRVRLLDDAVEVGEDLYERANDRLIEHRNFLTELWVEIAIFCAISAELAILLVDFLRR